MQVKVPPKLEYNWQVNFRYAFQHRLYFSLSLGEKTQLPCREIFNAMYMPYKHVTPNAASHLHCRGPKGSISTHKGNCYY